MSDKQSCPSIRIDSHRDWDCGLIGIPYSRELEGAEAEEALGFGNCVVITRDIQDLENKHELGFLKK